MKVTDKSFRWVYIERELVGLFKILFLQIFHKCPLSGTGKQNTTYFEGMLRVFIMSTCGKGRMLRVMGAIRKNSFTFQAAQLFNRHGEDKIS